MKLAMLNFASQMRKSHILSRLRNKTICTKYVLSIFPDHEINELLGFFFVRRRRNYSYWIVDGGTDRHTCDYFYSPRLCSLCIGYIYKTCINIPSFYVYKYLFDIFSKYSFIF